MRTTKLQIVILAAIAFASVGTLQASITGSIWEGVVGNAAPTDIPARPADVTFSVDSPLDFDSRRGGSYTIGSWLATGGATILTGASEAGNTMNGTIFQFIGQVSVLNGQTFTVNHDDGLTLIIGGVTVINEPGPTAPTTTTRTYTGPSGNLPFQLVYGEGWGAPAVLQIDLPFSAVPEPSTCIAGALLLLPFGAGLIRKLRKA